jgi:hypothetical protein
MMAKLEALIAAAKIGKYATSESGDTLEIVERPAGGLSCVLVDGQRSGKSAKAISNVVTRKAISLLADGVRDGAAARAASDYLVTYRAGKVLATLNILSVDLSSRSMVVSRNNPVPVLMIRNGRLQPLDGAARPVGTRIGIRPSIREFPLEKGLAAIVYTDGLVHAGKRIGAPMDVVACVQSLLDAGPIDPQRWADHILGHALDLDEGRPADDMSVLVAGIVECGRDGRRRLSMRMPLDPC